MIDFPDKLSQNSYIEDDEVWKARARRLVVTRASELYNYPKYTSGISDAIYEAFDGRTAAFLRMDLERSFYENLPELEVDSIEIKSDMAKREIYVVVKLSGNVLKNNFQFTEKIK